MKLIRYGSAGHERPGLIDAEGGVRDLSAHVDDIDGDALRPDSLDRLRALDPKSLPRVDEPVRFGPPVARVGKIVCIGLNYADHAAEASLPTPTEPVVFFKSTTAICGPDDEIVLPPASGKTDWELELAVVIGTPARSVVVENALAYVAGYAVALDMSERYWQIERGGQWCKGKSFDTFAPIGPWLVTPDELPPVDAFDLTLLLNEKPVQQGHSGNMIFGPAQLVSYVSAVMTLLPGDVLFTGTPAGVGMGRKPPRFLSEGDRLDATITGLGTQTHVVRAG